MEKGSAFLKQSGTPDDPERMHLFVVLTPPCNNNHQLIVPICSIKEGIFHDPSCILDVGDNAFIQRPSYVLYRRIDKIHKDHLDQRISNKTYIHKENVSDQVLEKIKAGIMTSSLIPRWAKKEFLQWPNS